MVWYPAKRSQPGSRSPYPYAQNQSFIEFDYHLV
nr:MAG TPA: hypothetical protein [Caudoviricetes sp.]